MECPGAAYARAARDAKDDVKLVVIPSAGHHEFMVPGSVTWPAIIGAMKPLLKV